MTVVQPTRSLEALLAEKVSQGASFDSLMEQVLPAPVSVGTSQEVPAPIRWDEPVLDSLEALRQAVLTDSAKALIPSTRRTLTPLETQGLIELRDSIGTLESALSAAKESIRTAVLNHLDLLAEKEGVAAAIDSKGHVLASGRLGVPGGGAKEFSWEVSGRTEVTDADLRQAVQDGAISHEDYLAVTVAERRFDEVRFLEHARKHPEIISSVGKAARRSWRGMLYLRKAKR